MDIIVISIVIYIIIGVVFSYKWFQEDYEEEYHRLTEEGEEVENGMVSLLLLAMIVFWLPMLIVKIIKAL